MASDLWLLPVVGGVAVGGVTLDSQTVSVGVAVGTCVAVFWVGRQVQRWVDVLGRHGQQIEGLTRALQSRPCFRQGGCLVAEQAAPAERKGEET
jgi:hypothetical protein